MNLLSQRSSALSTNASAVSVLLALLALSACSDGGTELSPSPGGGVDGSQPDTPDGGGTGNGGSGTPGEGPLIDPTGELTTISADTTVPALATGTRAQAYVGSVGERGGVFLLNDHDQLLGLATDSTGSTRSVLAELADEASAQTLIRQFTHRRAETGYGYQLLPFNEAGTGRLEFGEGDEQHFVALEVIDGQLISGNDDGLEISLSVAQDADILPISGNALQGTWVGGYTLCDAQDQNCSTFTLQFTIDGTEISGRSAMLSADGTDHLPSQVSGVLAQRGAVMDISLDWNTYVYDGFVYVDASNDMQLMLVSATSSETADNRMLVSAMVRPR